MDALIRFIQSLDPTAVLILVSIVILWLFAKAIRWLLNIALIAALIFVIIWKISTVQTFFINFIK